MGLLGVEEQQLCGENKAVDFWEEVEACGLCSLLFPPSFCRTLEDQPSSPSLCHIVPPKKRGYCECCQEAFTELWAVRKAALPSRLGSAWPSQRE